jgi:hypothetical protein
MNLHILTRQSNIQRLLWLQIPPLARWALLAACDGDVGELPAGRVAKVASWYQEAGRVNA